MPLSPGTRIGSYEVLAKLGEGGMGEVYRARDGRLNRDVALKILPQAFALDPDRLARFKREAQVLASLNHHNIAAIYGFEESPDVQGLALELVEGPTLADRIARGPIPIDESLAIAKQIADALEAAHEQGIVHRDLKPANIKLRPDGTAKVLDFGLAKALEPASALADVSNSPTITSPAIGATGVGVILGTAAYMAPEQAKGRPADKRSDIWSYGVVLVEMLTGRPVYSGETVSEVLAAVIMQEPDLTSLPPALPRPVSRLIRRCLQKDPKRRMRDIGEARLALEEKADEAGSAPAPYSPSNRWLVGLTAVLAVALAAAVGFWWRDRTVVSPPVITRYDVNAPAEMPLNLADRPAVALSPDGSTLAFTVLDGGTIRLFVRRRDEAEARAVPGSDGAGNPLFSPDGKTLAFFSGTELKSYADGVIRSVAKADTAINMRGLTWLDNGSLVYPPGNATGLIQTSMNGGAPKVLSTVDRTKGERTHRWPSAIPGGKAVLFTVGTQASPDDYDGADIDALVLATGERRLVLKGASMATYVPTGHLLFARGGSLYAVAFDPGTLTVREPAQLVVPGVAGDRTTGAAHFSVAADGSLAYVPGTGTTEVRWVWADRRGQLQALPLPAGSYADPQISPDGSRVALVVIANDNRDIWIHNFSTKTFTRLTFGGQNWTPAWSADGTQIIYTAGANSNATSLMRKPADGSADAVRIAQIDGEAYLTDVHDHTAILHFREAIGQPQPSAKFHVVSTDLKTPGKVAPLMTTGGVDIAGALSPNGRFLAYGSDESGRPEVYVRDFPGLGGRWQISTAGGEEPHWSADGRELFYRYNDLMMAVPVDTRAAFQFSTPALLFKGVYNVRSSSLHSFAVDPKSGRFLLMRPTGDDSERAHVRVVLNWFEELKQRMAAR
jgi:eukaryotic-like serine/threonine-protein kinase